MTVTVPSPLEVAREAAMEAFRAHLARPAALVEYRSAGRLLVVGSEERIRAVAQRLGGALSCVGLVPTPTGSAGSVDRAGLPTVRTPGVAIDGYLGAYRVTLTVAGTTVSLGEVLPEVGDLVDLVLDLGDPPLLSRELPPPGYLAPRDDPLALEAALAELPELVGEFEKPRYFAYDPGICAHARSGITACTRCIDACPAEAIVSIGERVEVNPHLCQGAGSCATACPTGAIRYAYPAAGDTLEAVRAMLRAYREHGGAQPTLLFHDREWGQSLLAGTDGLAADVLPVAVEEAGSVGLEVWLAALAYGAGAVRVLLAPGAPARVRRVVDEQVACARALLLGMGYPPEAIEVVNALSGDDLTRGAAALAHRMRLPPAAFAGLDEKRTVARLALDHLHEHAPARRPLVSLPVGAPFGEVWLAAERCTLCMACVSQCPGRALRAGEDTPQLRFIEENCVQCGLCARSCPENAIGPSPRYLFDPHQRRSPRLLKEEPPFCCIRCGKPFATRSVIDRMTARLAGHPMFRGPALARLQMCEDCRVKDLYEAEAVGLQGPEGDPRGT